MSGQRVGVVGEGRSAVAVEAAGGEPIEAEGPGFEMTDVQFVLASGESAIAGLARSAIDVPILPVAADTVRSVPFERLEATVRRVLETEQPTISHPVVSASGSFGSVRSVFDIALMAAEPARISEFSVHRGDERISQFRADGVVASTPLGSGGYNRSAGGPILESGTDVASVVPIAPFAMSAGHWVLSIDSVRLSVERDETPVELLSDGRRELIIEAGDAASLSRIGSFETYVLPERSRRE